jgi:hypothetical protein
MTCAPPRFGGPAREGATGPGPVPPPERLAERLRDSRGRTFVGREPQLGAFRGAVAGGFGVAVLFVHGPTGIGKSALLRRFADLAGEAGRPVIEVDAHLVAGPDEFHERAGAALDDRRAVLMLDGVEHHSGLESWLTGTFLPGLPVGGLVVVAGRYPPDPRAWSDPGWVEALQPVPLGPLSPMQSSALLRTLRAPARLRPAIVEFAAGHPLTLRLAAEAVRAERETGPADDRPERAGRIVSRWSPAPATVERLLAQLVPPMPSPEHRQALEVCAHAMATTDDLLQAALPGVGAAMFEWLRHLPFIEAGRHGLHPPDPVRHLIEADLRWRDPQAYHRLADRVRDHLVTRALEATGPEVLPAVAALLYPHRRHRIPGLATWHGESEVHEDAFRPGDRAAVLDLAEAAEGPESAAIVEFWLGRRPSAFRVHRDPETGRARAFGAWLRLERYDEEEIEADPVVAAIWTHSRGAGPVRAGEQVGVARFCVDPTTYQRPGPLGDLLQLRTVAEWIQAEDVAWTYTVLADPEFWTPAMSSLDQRPVSAGHGPVEVGSRRYSLFAHDWRVVPREEWFRHQAALLRAGPSLPAPAGRLVVLSRPEFDAAVRDALRSRHDLRVLSDNPLIRSRLVLDRVDRGGDDPAATLRSMLDEALDAVREHPRHARLHPVLTTTFSLRAPTQESAARQLHLPFSTYRRHLSAAMTAVCDALWWQETRGTAAS